MEVSRPTTWEPLPLKCKNCSQEWQDRQPSHVRAETWIAHIETLSCPKCRSSFEYLLILNRKPEEIAE